MTVPLHLLSPVLGNNPATIQGPHYEQGLRHQEERNYLKAFECFQKGAEANPPDPRCCYLAAKYLIFCSVIRKDLRQAWDYLERGVKAGGEGAADCLALQAGFYRSNYLFEVDFEKARSIAKEAYQQGSVEACYQLGEILFAEGENQKAIELLEEGSRQNHVLCKDLLGQHYWEGNNLPLDQQKAFQLWKEAGQSAEIEGERALYNLSIGLKTNGRVDESFECLQKASLSGRYSFRALGWSLVRGYHDRQDVQHGLDLLRKAGDRDDDIALFELSELYYTGQGEDVHPSHVAAYAYAKRAVALGNKEAYRILGNCKRYGHGTTVDIPGSVDCYRRANTFLPLAEHYKDKNEPQLSLHFLHKAARESDLQAIEGLFLVYNGAVEGYTSFADPDMATVFLRIGCKFSLEWALEEFGNRLSSLRGQELFLALEDALTVFVIGQGNNNVKPIIGRQLGRTASELHDMQLLTQFRDLLQERMPNDPWSQTVQENITNFLGYATSAHELRALPDTLFN